MSRTFFAAALIVSAAPALASDDEVKFEPSSEQFADASACKAHLQRAVSTAEKENYAAVRGPYEITEGDVRVHMVRAEGGGHRIWEHRCIGKDLSSRTWSHSMEAAEEAFTVESAARKAEWLKKDAPKQKQ
jgi:hypothetical protein